MAKPLLSPTFFSFPKLLLWSLPLIALFVYTWLANGLAGSRLLPFILQVETWEHKLASHVRLPSRLCQCLQIISTFRDIHVRKSKLSLTLFRDM